MPLVEKQPNAPLGLVTISVDNYSFTITDGQKIDVYDPDTLAFIANGQSPLVRLVGGAQSLPSIPQSNQVRTTVVLPTETPIKSGLEFVLEGSYPNYGLEKILFNGKEL